MGIINVLDIHVANLIAAGEVVERPASAVKELIENSVDAGATKITVEIKKGGIAFIRVCDNGNGMSREDVPVCIKRHATSKIKDQWDLGKIMTLGFRGEALAAIASVSKVRIMTKRQEDKTGTLMVSNPGEEVVVAETGCPNGTTVIVEELFANVPARRKFLKKDMTEGMAVSNIVEKIALSRPDISIKFISDDNVKFCTAGDGKLSNVIYALYGREFTKKITPVDWMTDGVKVYGYIGNPDNNKNNRNSQIVFVNDRYVRNKTVSAALEQAYDSYIPEGKFPCCVLKIEVHPAFVDANVHPTKAEVKFSDERQIFEAVYSTVRGALEKSVARPEMVTGRGAEFDDDLVLNRKINEGLNIINSTVPIREKINEQKVEKLSFDTFLDSEDKYSVVPEERTADEQVEDRKFNFDYSFELSIPNIQNTVEKEPSIQDKALEKVDYKADAEIPSLPTRDTDFDENYGGRVESPGGKYVYETEAEEESKVTYYRLIGEAFYSYIIVELEDRLLFIDKHAAHERMIFEELKNNMKKKKNVLQFLLMPIELPLESIEKATVNEYFDEISAIGYEIRFEDSGKAMLYAIPIGLEVDDAVDLFMSVCTRLGEGTGSALLSKNIVFEKALYQASCKAAIKAGRPDAAEDTKEFVRKLLALPNIKYCPHGRPVAFEVTKDTLEKQFKRK